MSAEVLPHTQGYLFIMSLFVMIGLLGQMLRRTLSSKTVERTIAETVTGPMSYLVRPTVDKPQQRKKLKCLTVRQPFNRQRLRSTVFGGRQQINSQLTKQQLISLSLGLKSMRSLNKTINKSVYYMSAELYEKSKMLNGKYRKRWGNTMALTPVYENVAY